MFQLILVCFSVHLIYACFSHIVVVCFSSNPLRLASLQSRPGAAWAQSRVRSSLIKCEQSLKDTREEKKNKRPAAVKYFGGVLGLALSQWKPLLVGVTTTLWPTKDITIHKVIDSFEALRAIISEHICISIQRRSNIKFLGCWDFDKKVKGYSNHSKHCDRHFPS